MALLVSVCLVLDGFRIRYAVDYLDLSVGYRLDIVQVAHTIAADSGGLIQSSLGDSISLRNKDI